MEIGSGERFSSESSVGPTDRRRTTASADAMERSDFRFTNSSVVTNNPDSYSYVKPRSASNQLQLSAPRLSDIYGENVTFRVLSGSTSGEMRFSASLPVSSLAVGGEGRDLILTLYGGDVDAVGAGRLQPTLRLHVRLDGPLRPEVSALVDAGRAWFTAVDRIASFFGPSLAGLPSAGDVARSKFFLLPAVPVAVLAAALAPAAAGAMVVGLPFFLPLLVFALAAALGGGTLFAGVAASTAEGRKAVGAALSPAISTFVATGIGQRAVYNTGPRVSPLDFADLLLPRDMLGKLVTSLVVDLIGSSSYLIPLVGEAFDLAWAPMSMTLVASMYDAKFPRAKYLAFAEEIMPFTDLIPTASACWIREFGPELLNAGVRKLEEMQVVPVRGNADQ